MQTELVNWLLAHYGQEQMRPGLDRISVALKNLLPKFKNTRIITIAGTNGKGETTLRLSKLLEDHTHYVWTSPHIERITERFRNEQGEIELETLKKLILSCHDEVKAHGYELSFYEFLFFVFCTWAAQNPPEFLLLEVGLGGRLDAVNALDAELVLLPSISRDHQEILGRRYDQILLEKLGVARNGALVLSYFALDYLSSRAQSYLQQLGASYQDLGSLVKVESWDFSRRNFLLAAAAYCHLLNRVFLPEEWSYERENLPMRGEVIHGQNEWHFFGSHNVDGMRKLIQFLHSENYNFFNQPFDGVVTAFSQRSEKDLRIMLRMLKHSFKDVVVTSFVHPKAASIELMKALAQEEGLYFVDDIQSYVQGWNKRRVLVTGSYYFIGQFKSHISC